MSRYARKVDGNQRPIVTALRGLGAYVQDVSKYPVGFDLLIGWRGRVLCVEIKNGLRPPSARKLTANEAAIQSELARIGSRLYIVNDEREALALLGAREAV